MLKRLFTAQQRAKQWLLSNEDMLVYAVVVALVLYVIAASIESRIARWHLIDRITIIEKRCQ